MWTEEEILLKKLRKREDYSNVQDAPDAPLRLEVSAVGQGCGAGEVDAGVFDRRERAHSREGGFVATTLLHGPVVIGVPRIGQAFIELHAEVFEGRERSANEQTMGLVCRHP